MGIAVMPTYTFLEDTHSNAHPPEIALMVDHMKSWYGCRNTNYGRLSVAVVDPLIYKSGS